MLYDLSLLDVPKLLDLAALYGTGSPKLVHRLMQQVIAGRHCTCPVLLVDLAALYVPKLVHCLLWQVCCGLFICSTRSCASDLWQHAVLLDKEVFTAPPD